MQETRKSTFLPMLIIGALFFVFGFITWLNGTLIPYLRIACELNTFESLFVAFAFYISYFIMALPSSWILKKTGFKKGMMLGLFVMSVGAFIFIPAAQSRTYWIFLTGLFIIGTGLSILQTASNPYVTIVGPIESAARRISIMGICNKVAGVIAPLVLGAIVLKDADTLMADLQMADVLYKVELLNELSSRVILPYTFMAVALTLLGIMVLFSPLPDIDAENGSTTGGESLDYKTNIFQFPHLVLGVIALFFYVGVEVMAGDTISSYGQSQGINLSVSKNFTAYTLAAMVVGYVLGIISIPKLISQAKALAASAIIGVVFTIVSLSTSGYTSVLFIAFLGLANALMWPAIWPLAINGLGRFTKTASAMLIMAIAGGAILPLIYGRLADIEIIGNQKAYWIMVPCYLFILFYSLKGYKITHWRSH